MTMADKLSILKRNH